MANTQENYKSINDRTQTKSIIEKKQCSNQEIKFRDNRPSFRQLQKLINSNNVVQRKYEAILEKIYSLISTNLWRPMPYRELILLIEHIAKESKCIKRITHLYYGNECSFKKELVRFYKKTLSGKKNLLYSTEIISANPTIIQSFKDEAPQISPSSSSEVRIIFGRGKIVELPSESSSPNRDSTWLSALCEFRPFSIQYPTDINIDINPDTVPDIEGSVDAPETYSDIVSYLRKKKAPSKQVTVYFENLPFYQTTKDEESYMINRKKIEKYLQLFKTQIGNFQLHDTNQVFNESGVLIAPPELHHHHKHHHQHEHHHKHHEED